MEPHHGHLKNGMRVLIRRRRQQDYLQPSGEWGADRSTARNFISSVEACSWAHEENLAEVEVLLAFDDKSYDLVVFRT